MKNTERLAELKELSVSTSGFLTSRRQFNNWHGRVSGLLGFDPIRRFKFDALCDRMIQEHEFSSDFIDPDLLKKGTELKAILSRAISELEVNGSIETPAIHTPTLIASAPSLPIAASSPARIEGSPYRPSAEEGFFWFVYHCDYRVKLRIAILLLTSGGVIFTLGWNANKYRFFQEVGSSFHKVFYGEEAADRKDDKPKDAPKQP